MNVPTARQLKEAQESIRRDGTNAPATIALAMMCVKEPLTREVVANIAAASGNSEAVLMGAFVAGLNLGLRVTEEQEAQRREDFGPNGDATTPGFFK